VPGFAALRPDLLLGMVELGDSACLVLDGAALQREPSLLALAAVNIDAGNHATSDVGSRSVTASDAATDEDASTRDPSYVTYTAGLAVASPLTQVSEILPFPHALTPTAADGVLGLTVHRGRVVPVVCLSTLLGHPPEPRPASSCLLLVEVDGEQLAFAVDALGGIEPLTWSDPAAGERVELVDVTRAAHDSPLVQVAGSDRLVPALDLRDVAQAVRTSTNGQMSGNCSTVDGEVLNADDQGPMVAA
jgi:purine-binding chemotaxis protein CheW